METLNKITITFDSLIDAIKTKKSTENVKKYFNSLNIDLVEIRKEGQEHLVRSLAMEGYLALLALKTLPLSPQDKLIRLKTAYDSLKAYSLRDECLFVYLRIQNLLCYHLIRSEELTLARDFLETTENIYDHMDNCNEDGKYCDPEDLFTTKPLDKVKKVNQNHIDKVITNNIQMQAFLYKKMNLPNKYAAYSHSALERQLRLKDGTPQDWATRAGRLGDFYLSLKQVENARYHLCAAYHVLSTCRDNCDLLPEELVPHKNDFDARFIELIWHWIKYGMTLFQLSKRRALGRYFEQAPGQDLWKTVDEDDLDLTEKGADNTKDFDAEKSGEGDATAGPVSMFSSLDLQEIEKHVPVKCVTTSAEARHLFAFTHKWMTRAKDYYNFEHDSSQYTLYSLQLSELYEHLAFFERHVESQYNIQKRRAEVLENLSVALRGQDDAVTIKIDVLRELSQVQLELMALNMRRLWSEESQLLLCKLDDTESVANSTTKSNKTATEISYNTLRNTTLHKMEATSSMNERLFRFCGQLASTPSQLSFATL